MLDILVTADDLLQVAELFFATERESQEVVTQLQRAMGTLEQGWDGVAQQRFYEDYQRWHSQMQQFVELLDSIGQRLRTIAEGFAAADQQLASGQAATLGAGGTVGPASRLAVEALSPAANPAAPLLTASGALTGAGMLLVQQRGWSGFLQALRGPAGFASDMISDLSNVQGTTFAFKNEPFYKSIKRLDSDGAEATLVGISAGLDFLSGEHHTWRDAEIAGVSAALPWVATKGLTVLCGPVGDAVAVAQLADLDVELVGGLGVQGLEATGHAQGAKQLDNWLQAVDFNQGIDDASHAIAKSVVDHGLLQDAVELSPAGPLLSFVDPSMFPPKTPVDMFYDLGATEVDLGTQAAQALPGAAAAVGNAVAQTWQLNQTFSDYVQKEEIQAAQAAASAVGSAVSSGGQRLLTMLGL